MGPSSCDRCYGAKAKCSYPARAQTCYRCLRLHHQCTTARVRRQRGRRRRDELLAESSTNRNTWIVNGAMSCTSEMQDAEEHQQVLSMLWSSDEFIAPFVIGINFANVFRQGLASGLSKDPGLVRPTLLATAAAFLRAQHGILGAPNPLSLSRTASSLKKLRTYDITDTTQLAVLSTMGLSMITFETITSCISAHAIAEHTLSLLRPWYPLLTQNPGLDSNLNCLIFMDTINCLVRRNKAPVLKYVSIYPHFLDRALGLCCTLLPLLHDLCYPFTCDPAFYASIKIALQTWQPNLPSDFYTSYSPAEVTIMLSQARVYPDAALLLHHRLKHPYGSLESQSQETTIAKAGSILHQLAACFAATGRYPFMTFFPFLMSALELDELHARGRSDVLAAIDTRWHPIYSAFLVSLRKIIVHVWAVRDRGGVISWRQVVDSMPGLFFLP